MKINHLNIQNTLRINRIHNRVWGKSQFESRVSLSSASVWEKKKEKPACGMVNLNFPTIIYCVNHITLIENLKYRWSSNVYEKCLRNEIAERNAQHNSHSTKTNKMIIWNDLKIEGDMQSGFDFFKWTNKLSNNVHH